MNDNARVTPVAFLVFCGAASPSTLAKTRPMQGKIVSVWRIDILDAVAKPPPLIVGLAARIALNARRGVSKAQLPVPLDDSTLSAELRSVERLK